MNIKLGVTPNSNGQALTAWLQAMACQPDAADATTWYLDNPAPEPEAERVLLAYQPPAPALQHAMAQGEAPEAALQRWVTHARRLLAYFKAHRRTTVLIDLEAMRQAPREAASCLARHWQWSAEPPATFDLPALPRAEGLNQAFYQLLALQALQQHRELKGLLAQLEACSLPLSATPPEPPQPLAADALFAQWQAERQRLGEQAQRAQQALEAASQQKAGLEEENRLLLEQLHAVQEELERVHHRPAADDTAVREEKARLQEQLATREAERKQREADHQALAAQKATLDKQLEAQKATIQQQAETLDAATVRQRDLEEENTLLLEQLHLVQEELERLFLARRQLAEQLQQQEQRQQQVEREQVLALAAAHQQRRHGAGRHARRSLKQDYQHLAASRLFDRDWYLRHYPDVADAGVDPIKHYLKAGAQEGRQPGPEFDTVWYLLHYRDVVTSGFNPLVHYLRFGHREGRAPSPGHQALPAPRAEADNAPAEPTSGQG